MLLGARGLWAAELQLCGTSSSEDAVGSAEAAALLSAAASLSASTTLLWDPALDEATALGTEAVDGDRGECHLLRAEGVRVRVRAAFFSFHGGGCLSLLLTSCVSKVAIGTSRWRRLPVTSGSRACAFL